MRETVGSLRAYFILVGVLSGLQTLNNLSKGPGMIGLVLLVINLMLSVAFLYAGARLPSLLRERVAFLVRLVWTAMSFNCLVAVLLHVVARSTPFTLGGTVAYVIVGALIGFYLARNVRRLAAAQTATPAS